jgi:hypothetical protein
VNDQGGFGVWESDVSYNPSDLKEMEILVQHNSST